MKKNKSNSKEKKPIESLNEELYSSFSIEELEDRLEAAGWIACAVDNVDCPGLYCGKNT